MPTFQPPGRKSISTCPESRTRGSFQQQSLATLLYQNLKQVYSNMMDCLLWLLKNCGSSTLTLLLPQRVYIFSNGNLYFFYGNNTRVCLKLLELPETESQHRYVRGKLRVSTWCSFMFFHHTLHHWYFINGRVAQCSQVCCRETGFRFLPLALFFLPQCCSVALSATPWLHSSKSPLAAICVILQMHLFTSRPYFTLLFK